MKFSNNKRVWLVALAAASALTVFLFYPAIADKPYARSADPSPAGWIVFSSRTPDEESIRCANYSKREWIVSANDGQIAIAAQQEQRKVDTIEPFRGGELRGVDHGEFGGGLWWTSADGTINEKISTENVHGLVETTFGTLALTGLAHMHLDFGSVLLITDESPLPPKATLLADLGGAPNTFTKDSSGNVIVVTNSWVLQIKPPGRVEKLFSSDYGSLYPNSVVIFPSGVMYLGMRHFVTRITPTGNRYREDWLVPPDCPAFEKTEFDCVCMKKR